MTTSPATTLAKAYEPQTIEAELYARWEAEGLFAPAGTGPAFSLVIPPPNVTGTLHMGHALDNTLQDILVRWHRMHGDRTLWMPGTDHAGIATQSVVERHVQKQGKTRHDYGREAFVDEIWQWVDRHKGAITGQLKRLGVSPDWPRERFTLDDGCSKAVRTAFKHLYDSGLIYRGEYIVNWDPVTQSAISDVETDYTDEDSFLWEIAYPVVVDGTDSGETLVVATTRPETMIGDVAVCVHPDDARYQNLIGKTVRLPLTDKHLPVIADDYVDRAFGTGVLKITPAHDPNDFVLGRKHGLESIRVLDNRAAVVTTLDFIPEALRGLDRMEARTAIEAQLEAAGHLVRKINHKHRVGRAQRSGAIIEPLLSEQWFVKTQPLAERCLKALDDGEIRFIPERWTRDYLRWMENIKDWCISRQLWWGHRIPVWHCADCAQHTVPADAADPTACEHCGSDDIKQDPDVLDTWFSSGLWPFSTMGWPNADAPDYQTFYPTSVLVTGCDIIFFWVARMAMFGHELTGKSPFHTVYIHGLIRDEKGQKMSKSKGNTVDPVKAIEQYGCDGFRFALTSLVTHGGQDIKLNPEKLETGKLFANKLWNAARFVLMNLDGVDDQPIDAEACTPMDRWILSQTHATIAEANALLDAYKFADWASVLYEFTWNAFCDWYVEAAKAQLREPDNDRVAANTRRVLREVLSTILRLLHPVMPFITETLWAHLPHPQPHTGGNSIMHAPYPQADATWLNPTMDSEITLVLAVVRAIRNIRQQYTVPYTTPVSVVIEAPVEAERAALFNGEAIIRRFVTIDTLDIVPALDAPPAQAGANVVGQCRIFVPLAGVIDLGQEAERLAKKQQDLKEEQAQLYKMMDNQSFLERAPQAVVQKNKDRLHEVNQQLKALDEQLTGLSG